MNRSMAVVAALALGAGVALLLVQAPATTAQDAAEEAEGWDWGALKVPPRPAEPDPVEAPAPEATPAAEAQAVQPDPVPAQAEASEQEAPAAEAAAAEPADAAAEEAAAEAAATTGWDWSALQADDEAPPTGSGARDDTDQEAAAGGGSGWDWGAFEADDTPVTTQRRRTTSTQAGKAEPEVPRRPAEAAPDFDAPPHDGYALFANVPAFRVVPAARDQEMHPCGNCHEWAKSDLTPRRLAEPHDNFELEHGMHGKGGFWCFTCHDLSGAGGLRTLEGERLEFEEAYVLCSQCHVDEARDWAFGAHGKRVANWQGERKIYNCTACHYQHAPEIPLREPLAPPPARMGLQRPAPPQYDGHGHGPLWEVQAASAHQEGAHEEATP